MKITSNGFSQMLKSYSKGKRGKVDKVNNGKRTDQLSLSKEALELQKSKGDFKEVYSSSQERISNIKNRIEQGNYKVSGEDIAKKMLEYISLNKKF